MRCVTACDPCILILKGGIYMMDCHSVCCVVIHVSILPREEIVTNATSISNKETLTTALQNILELPLMLGKYWNISVGV